MGPVFLNQLLVLADLSLAGVRSPAGGGRVAEADVDVRVMFDFVEFVADVVSEEDKVTLSVVLGCMVS
jgi:hypothetical protein